MGNSSSKPESRNSSSSSSTVLSSPHTPDPLLGAFPEHNNTPHLRLYGRSPASSTSSNSPITPVLPAFSFPGRENVAAKEVTVATFAGESPPASRPTSGSKAQPPPATAQTEPQDISEISHPTPARPHIRHLSELIDPTLLADDDKYVRSPSGNLLGRRSFEGREDRPLSMRERQERVRQQVMLARSQAGLRETADTADVGIADPEKAGGVKKIRGCLSCFGS